MKYVGYAILGLVGLAVLGSLLFGAEWLGLKWKGYFAPKHAAVERRVFRQTRSYNEAKEQQLLKLRLEYLQATDPQDKAALGSTIRHSFADYDENLLESEELRGFLRAIKYGH